MRRVWDERNRLQIPGSWGPNLAAASPARSWARGGGRGDTARQRWCPRQGARSHGRRRPPAHGPAPRPRPPRPRARSGFSSHLVPFPFLPGPAPGALPPPPPAPRPQRPSPPPRRAPSPPRRTCRAAGAGTACHPGGPATKAVAAAAAAASRPRPRRRRAAPERREGPRHLGPPARRPRALTEWPGRGPGPRGETPRAPARLSQRHPRRLSGFPCARPLGRERGGHVVGGGGSGRELRVLGGEGEERG